MKFRDMLKEKIESKINNEWIVVELDDGTELSTSVQLVTDKKIQICLPTQRVGKRYTIEKDVLSTIHSALGYKIDLNNAEIDKLIKLYPCKGQH